ncbi:MAG: NUDIX domain-containing protein [Gammaproteobacteria bacterium]|nr:NUDIX domain-containing protein [Gammaproteobacteria bacterium]
MKFCSSCGSTVAVAIPQGDNRPRHVCNQCGTIHYQNPKVVAGCIPVWKDKVLLCKRAIEPRRGYWTLPAGFMENSETLEQGAIRETWEEACAKPVNPSLYAIYSLPRINQIYVMFRADIRSSDDFGIGEESLEVKLFTQDEIPWENMAFKVISLTLARYFKEYRTGKFNFVNDIID